MADVSQIKLPDNTVVDIKDEIARNVNVSATYTSNTKNLELSITSAASVDNTEY